MQTELKSRARFPESLYEPWSETRKRRQSKFSASTSLADTNWLYIIHIHVNLSVGPTDSLWYLIFHIYHWSWHVILCLYIISVLLIYTLLAFLMHINHNIDWSMCITSKLTKLYVYRCLIVDRNIYCPLILNTIISCTS